MRQLPESVEKLINDYMCLDIEGKCVQTPYFINSKKFERQRADLRSLIGKATPEEIIDEVKIYAKVKGFDLTHASCEKIKSFMKENGIGIDCSGFVAHILNTWLKSQGTGTLRQNLKYPPSSLFRRIARLTRPIVNTSADVLTNDTNTEIIRYSDVEPGDLLRLSRNQKRAKSEEKHVVIVTKVEKNIESQNLEKIIYAHSTYYYAKKSGVKTGAIEINQPGKELKDQNWTETDSSNSNRNWTFEKYLKDVEDNGFRRPKFFIES